MAAIPSPLYDVEEGVGRRTTGGGDRGPELLAGQHGYRFGAALLARTGTARARRGVTLVEVLIVVAIMAVIAGGATLLVFPQFRKAKVEAAKVGADAVKQAGELWMNVDAEGGACPTVNDLVESKKLDAKKTDDPFGKPYRIVCEEGGDLRVYSNGRDGKEGTPDDIRDDFKPSDIKRVADL